MPAASNTNLTVDTNGGASGEVSGFLTVRYKGGKRTRWKRKYAVLRQDVMYLSDEQGSSADDTTELRLPGVFNTCGAYNDKKAKKKHGFVLEPAMDGEEQDQWYFTCEDQDDQQRWMNAINDVISGKKVQKAVSCPEFDDIIVQSTTLNHLAKGRPKFHGRRLPAKRPIARSENALNGIPESSDGKIETPDSSQPNSPARDLATNGASTSAPSSPANKGFKDSPVVKRRHEAKKRGTFLRGIGARVSRMFGTQPPRSPTSPGRLSSETTSPPVLPQITIDEDNSKSPVNKLDEDDEDVPDVVTKEDIIKMLDFVSESTEQIVYKAVGIRGAITSVDEHKSKEVLRNTSRSLRQAVKSLKGTMDSLSRAEDAMKSATDAHSTGAGSSSEAADDATPANGEDKGDQIAEDTVEENTKDNEVRKSSDLDTSLESNGGFDKRHQSISLMDAIQNTLNHEANQHDQSTDDVDLTTEDVATAEEDSGPMATSEKKSDQSMAEQKGEDEQKEEEQTNEEDEQEAPIDNEPVDSKDKQEDQVGNTANSKVGSVEKEKDKSDENKQVENNEQNEETLLRTEKNETSAHAQSSTADEEVGKDKADSEEQESR